MKQSRIKHQSCELWSNFYLFFVLFLFVARKSLVLISDSNSIQWQLYLLFCPLNLKTKKSLWVVWIWIWETKKEMTTFQTFYAKDPKNLNRELTKKMLNLNLWRTLKQFCDIFLSTLPGNLIFQPTASGSGSISCFQPCTQTDKPDPIWVLAAPVWSRRGPSRLPAIPVFVAWLPVWDLPERRTILWANDAFWQIASCCDRSKIPAFSIFPRDFNRSSQKSRIWKKKTCATSASSSKIWFTLPKYPQIRRRCHTEHKINGPNHLISS